MRYTLRGGIIVGCRRRGEMLRIDGRLKKHDKTASGAGGASNC
jgi:hypothetical protein